MATPVMKRIMREAQQIQARPVREFHAYPLEDNLLEWHFTLRGPDNSPFAEGLYHGKVVIPVTYPFSPPDVILLTPNGRFALNQKICLSITSYHPENWQSTWGVATVLTALRDFMATPGNNGIGAIEYPAETRKTLAEESKAYVCDVCGQCTKDHGVIMNASRPGGEPDPIPPSTPLAAAKSTAAPSQAPASPLQGASSPLASTPPPMEKTPLAESAPPAETAATPAPIPNPTTAVAAAPEAAPVAEPLAVAAPPATPPANAAAQPAAPARPVALRRHGGGLEIRLSAALVDKLIIVVCLIAWIIIAKKLILDSWRDTTTFGKWTHWVIDWLMQENQPVPEW